MTCKGQWWREDAGKDQAVNQKPLHHTWQCDMLKEQQVHTVKQLYGSTVVTIWPFPSLHCTLCVTWIKYNIGTAVSKSLLYHSEPQWQPAPLGPSPVWHSAVCPWSPPAACTQNSWSPGSPPGFTMITVYDYNLMHQLIRMCNARLKGWLYYKLEKAVRFVL